MLLSAVIVLSSAWINFVKTLSYHLKMIYLTIWKFLQIAYLVFEKVKESAHTRV